MNDEIIKAMNRFDKYGNSKLKTWWQHNSYKVFRVILFPIYLGSIICNKITLFLNSKEEWSDDRTDQIFNYYVPRFATWDTDANELYFFDNGYGWNYGYAKKYLKRKDRRYWKVHNGFCGGRLRHYLVYDFQLDGFTKELGCCSDGWTEVIFALNADQIES